MPDKKITCGSKPWIFPLPVSIVGIEADGGAKYTVTSNVGPLNVTPPIIYISLPGATPLIKTIKEKGLFSLNTPSTGMLPLISDLSKGDTTAGITSLYNDNKIPFISECPVNLICRFKDSFTINKMEVMVGQVEHTYVSSQYLTEGNRNPDMDKIDPLLHALDNKYYSAGRYLGEAFSIGNCYGKGISGNLKHLARSTGKKTILKGYACVTSIKKLLSDSREKKNQKEEIPARSLIYPLPTVLLGTYVDARPNYSVVVNCGLISLSPPVVYVSSTRSHHTNTGINKNNSFSINIPDTPLIKKTDYCGIVSGKKTDKSNVFTTFTGRNDHIPLIKECPVNLECRIIKIHPIRHMEIFIGEVVEAHINDRYLKQGMPDIQKINPIVYALNRKYWSVGKRLINTSNN